MDVVGSEIGQKMRSAIKAKLTELGCYVDDELPDYVMVMVANKRTRSQMEDDLQLFLGDNTLIFVNWLHHVLKKLQEVTVTPSSSVSESRAKKSRSASEERKPKERKRDKHSKSYSFKKSKKKNKTKDRIKKIKKKLRMRKKNLESKNKEMIRPNVPPLLMNMEKESEPSITDVFAGQILKNHGISLSDNTDAHLVDIKPFESELKRPFIPIIDPSTITATSDGRLNDSKSNDGPASSLNSAPLSKEEQIEQMNATEVKLQGLRQKLEQHLESMSDDEDMLEIRAEAEEFINNFNEELFEEEAAKTPEVHTAPAAEGPSQIASTQNVPEAIQPTIPNKASEVLPQIELNLPKWPAREKPKAVETKEVIEDATKTEERLTPDKINLRVTQDKERKSKAVKHTSARSQLEDDKNKTRKRKGAPAELSDRHKILKRSVCESTSREAERASPASVVMVRPRPKTTGSTSNLLMRAVADAQKSLRTVPSKLVTEQKVRALVRPIRRAILTPASNGQEAGSGTSGIVIEFKCDNKPSTSDEYVPQPLTKKFVNTNYTPTTKPVTTKLPISPVDLNPIDIHRKFDNKEKVSTTFVVTLDGLDPNIFLAQKLKSEGLLNNDGEIIDEPENNIKKEKEVAEEVRPDKSDKSDRSDKSEDSDKSNKSEFSDKSEKSNKSGDFDKSEKSNKSEDSDKSEKSDKSVKSYRSFKSDKSDHSDESDHSVRSDSSASLTSRGTFMKKKRLSDTSEDSDTQVIIQSGESSRAAVEPGRSVESAEKKPVKKRKASPIIFDVETKRAEPSKPDPAPVKQLPSPNSSKYEALQSFAAPIVAAASAPVVRPERKSVPCSAFPHCRYGASCAFTHPPCKFAASCTRRGCMFEHSPASTVAPASHTTFIASHVVPAANYKSITTAAGIPNLCKYYPKCGNPGCHFFHPKPCRYGRTCINKLDCNFYHYDAPSTKWRSTM